MIYCPCHLGEQVKPLSNHLVSFHIDRFDLSSYLFSIMQHSQFIIMGKARWLVLCFTTAIQMGNVDLNAQDSSAKSNAADFYIQAFAQLENLSPVEKKLLQLIHVSQPDAKENTIQVDERKLLERLEPVLELVQTASRLGHANWGSEVDDSPWIDLASAAKQLQRGLMLQARWLIEEEEFEQASNVIVSAVAFSRHIGQDGILISRLIESSTFKIVANLCAWKSTAFPKPVLKGMLEDLSNLPVSMTAKEVLLAESQYSARLSQQNGNPYPKKQIDDFLKFYDQVVAFGDLPLDQFEGQLKKLGDSFPDNIMIKGLLPLISRMKHQIAVHEVNTALLGLGLKVLLSGPQVVKNAKDPSGKGPFEYLPLKNESFELFSELNQRDEKLMLRFGS